MKIFVEFRYENASLVQEMCQRGHEVYADRPMAVYFRQLLKVPVQPVDFPDNKASFNGIFAHGQDVPGIIDGLTDLHERERLDALVLWTDAPTRQRAMALTARHLGIPSFEVIHGSTNSYRQGHFEYESYVDHILAPGQHEKDFRDFYGSKADVIVTGKPSFDWMTKLDISESRKTIRENFKIPPKRPVIMYAMTWRHPFSTWERDTNIGELEVIQAHMNLLPICNPYLIIKPHYAIGTKEYAKSVREFCDSNGVTDYGVMTGDPMFPLLAADMIVTHKSSIIVEAMLLDLPVVMFEFREWNDLKRFAGYGAELVDQRKELYPAMARCLLDKPTKERLERERAVGKHYFNGPCDGRAAERCVRTIEERVSAS